MSGVLRRRLGAAAALLVLAACAPREHRAARHRAAAATPVPAATPTAEVAGARLRGFYAKPDGERLGRFVVPVGAARDLPSLAYLAAVAAVAGPPAGVAAIRFPEGTVVRRVDVTGSVATVDLSRAVERTPPGGFAEAGEFKGLVWTMTDLPGVASVRVRVAGATVPTLPGGHFELDEPLRRTDW